MVRNSLLAELVENPSVVYFVEDEQAGRQKQIRFNKTRAQFEVTGDVLGNKSGVISSLRELASEYHVESVSGGTIRVTNEGTGETKSSTIQIETFSVETTNPQEFEPADNEALLRETRTLKSTGKKVSEADSLFTEGYVRT